ncbi:MAG: HNH endonuclease [Proteobacteria bacterium]|nr:HNH endonuclease [Pseudomonadota bacterium]
MSKPRDYKKEYQTYQGTREQLRKRSSRNKARRRLEKDGLVHKGDGKDVDHKDGNPLNNSRSNLHAMSASKNRSKK